MMIKTLIGKKKWKFCKTRCLIQIWPKKSSWDKIITEKRKTLYRINIHSTTTKSVFPSIDMKDYSYSSVSFSVSFLEHEPKLYTFILAFTSSTLCELRYILKCHLGLHNKNIIHVTAQVLIQPNPKDQIPTKSLILVFMPKFSTLVVEMVKHPSQSSHHFYIQDKIMWWPKIIFSLPLPYH